ncbi:uncharacterized protein LOC120634522 isoform X2 [Pararge aegeria]|nr:uncharacterized protein LOC120634522 isoform X2 [Pararge aegeria]
MDKLRKTLRFCSRHFPPNTIVNRHLTQEALPSKSLPGSIDEDEPDIGPEKHEGIICDSCQDPILGFRYKCVTCDNFDLCQKCEMLEKHPQHYMLRIPKSIKFQLADDLINKWRNLFKTEHIVPDCETSSDDEPVTKYIRNYDSGIDLTDEVKNDIRNEVARALKAADQKVAVPVQAVQEKKQTRNRSVIPKVEHKKIVDEDAVEVVPSEEKIFQEVHKAPELVFADVNADQAELKIDKADVKPSVADTSDDTLPVAMPNSLMTVETQPLLYVTLSNDLSQFMIELAPDNNASESSAMK